MKTKRLLQALAAVASIAATVSCKETISVEPDPGTATPFMSIQKTEFKAGAEASVLYEPVSANRTVVANTKADWFRVEIVEELPDAESQSKVSESTMANSTVYLKISVEANPETASRSGKAVLSASKCDDIEISVLQDGAEPPKSSACELQSFRISGTSNGLGSPIEFELDKATSTFSAKYLKWIEKEEPSNLSVEFTADAAKIQFEGTDLVSGQSSLSFAGDFDLVAVAENGDTKTYHIVFNCPQINTELPVFHFRPDSPITSKDTYVKTSIELYSPHTKEGWWSTSGGDEKVDMRGRGNSTWGLPKKPYRIKFPEKFSPIGLNHAKAKSWVLLAHDMDKSLLRNALGFELSRELYNPDAGYHDANAALFTPCTQYINVYKDGEYLGLYQMSDQMERDKGRVNIDKLEAADGSDPEKIKGGYLVEADLHEGNHISSHGIKWTIKYPKDDDYDPAQYDYIMNFINSAESALYGSNFKDPDKGWRRWFDEKTLVDFVIIKELAQDMDGYTSIYIHKVRAADKIFFGPVWDLDKGWDNDKRVPHANYPPLKSLMINAGFYMPPYVNPDWFHRLWQDDTFRAAVRKRWLEKKSDLVNRINTYLDKTTSDMAKAIDANYTVWDFYYQYSDEAKMPEKTYPEEIARIKRLTEERAALLDKLFN